MSSQYPPGLDKAKKRAIYNYTQASGDADRRKWRGLRRAEGTEGQSNHYCGRPEPNLGFVNHVDL